MNTSTWTATEQLEELNMNWAEENATFTSFFSESGSLLDSDVDGVNDGSLADYLFTLNDSFTVPQVDYSSESFSAPSQWPFLPPGRSSDCYPPPKSAMATTLLPEFSNEQPVILNQDDLIFNISAETGLKVLNLPFLEAD